MHPQHARENLIDAAMALTATGLQPFLVDGTLLGAVREGDFIAHDKDLDLGLHIAAFRPGFTRQLEVLGFALHRSYGAVDRGLQFSFTRRGIKLDIFFYYQDAEAMYHAAWRDGTPIRYGYAPFTLAPLAFLGHTFLAPADPEAFLVTKYGPDWRTPVTPWDWAWGPHNARPWVEAL